MATESRAPMDLTRINGVLPFWGRKRRRPSFPYEPYPDSPFNKLWDSLVFEILIRLPNPKSAVQCKSVCSWWAFLISSRSFAARFVSHHETTVLGGGGGNGEPPLILPGNPQPVLNFLPAPDEIRRKLRVLDSSHDLILCGTEEKVRNSEMGRTFVVCNPFTKQWVALPLAPERKTRYERSIVRLVFGPGKFCTNLNQGFMVVCMYVDGIDLAADFFCSASGKWSRDGMAFNWSTGRFPARNVASCKGKLYWRNMNRQVVVFNPLRQCSLVVLDISRFFVERLMYCDVWASQGVLHLIIIEHQGTVRSNDVLCVWRLDAGGVEEWRRLYRVSLKDMLSEVQGMEMKRVLGMHPNKPEIVFLEFVHIDGNTRVLSCNLQKQELQFFTEYRSASLDFLHWNVFQPILRWPTRIPRYEDLRGGFDGSSSFWVQKSNKSTAARSEVGSFLQRLQL